MKLVRCSLIAATAAALASSIAHAQVVINEFVYDTAGTDAKEFVELYNSGTTAVDISGWTIGGRDNGTTNASATITGAVGSSTTVLAPGAYYVLGQTGVPNSNQTLAAGGFLENDGETLELRDGAFATGSLVDAVVYETNKGATAGATSYGTLPADVAAKVGPGIFGNHQTNDLTTTPASTLARYRDGRTTNNNGRDFGMRSATPGASNTSPGVITRYSAPNVDALANDTVVPNYAFSFSGPRAITPGTVSTFNPNAIPAAPNGNAKVLTAWDSTGGGNAIADAQTMLSGGGFRINAYFDTNDMPQNSNANGVQFRGSEVTVFGVLGSPDALNNLTDVSGQIGVGSGISANGSTGLAWIYEKVGVNGATGVSEKLLLVDANDGGNSNSASTTALDWTILQTIDLSNTASGWYDLSIDVDALGNGTASFNGQTFTFTTTPNLDGAFYAGYRENTQVGSNLVPSFLRPPTWTVVPEPTTLAALVGLGGLAMIRRRKA